MTPNTSVQVLYVPDPNVESTPPRLLQFTYFSPDTVRNNKDNLLFMRDLLPAEWKDYYKLPNMTPYHGNFNNKDLYILRMSKFLPLDGGEEYQFEKMNPLYALWKPYFNTPQYMFGPFFVCRVLEEHGLITKTLTDLKIEDYFDHLIDEHPLEKRVAALFFPMDATQKPKKVLVESIFTDWVDDYPWSLKYSKHLPDCDPMVYEVGDVYMVLSFEQQKGQPLGENLNYSRWSKSHPGFPDTRKGHVIVLQCTQNAIADVGVLTDCSLTLKSSERPKTPPSRIPPVVENHSNEPQVDPTQYTQNNAPNSVSQQAHMAPQNMQAAFLVSPEGGPVPVNGGFNQQQTAYGFRPMDTSQQQAPTNPFAQQYQQQLVLEQQFLGQQQTAFTPPAQQNLQYSHITVQQPTVSPQSNGGGSGTPIVSRFSRPDVNTPSTLDSRSSSPTHSHSSASSLPAASVPSLLPHAVGAVQQQSRLSSAVQALETLELLLPDMPSKMRELQNKKNEICDSYDRMMREAPMLNDAKLQQRHETVANDLTSVLNALNDIEIGGAVSQMQRIQQLLNSIQTRTNGLIQSLGSPNLAAIDDSIRMECKSLHENIAIGQQQLQRIREAIQNAKAVRLKYRKANRKLEADDDEEEEELRMSYQERTALQHDVQILRQQLNSWHQTIQNEISTVLRKKYPLEYRIASRELQQAQLVEISKVRLSEEASELRDYLAQRQYLSVSSRATGYKNWIPLTVSGHISLCERVSDGQRCILKRLPLNRLMILRVHNEIEMLLRFQNNPNVISVNGCFIEGDEVFLEMNFHPDSLLWLKGRDVDSLLRAPVDYAQLLQQESAQSRDDILFVVTQLIETLKYLHIHGIEHRDLKPQNLLVESGSNVVKLIDFGISKDHQQDEQTSLMTTQAAGTMRYLAPEFKNRYSSGEQVIYARDIYALGVILFEMFALPSHMDRISLLHSGAAPLDQLLSPNGYFNGWIRDLALRCLDENPARRPTSAECHQFVQQCIASEKKQILSQIIPRNSKLSMVKTFLQTVSKKATESNTSHSFPLVAQDQVHHAILAHLSTLNDGNLQTLLERWKFSFLGQGGIDHGGLSNYAHTIFVDKIISSEIMQGTNSVFRLKDDPNLASVYKRVGKMMLRCLLLEIPVPWKLSRFVFSHLVGHTPPRTIEEMLQTISEYDSVLVRNLRTQLQNPASMGYSSREEVAQVIVRDYVRPHLFGEENGVLKNMDALREGFFCCTDAKLKEVISSLSGFELKLLLCDEHESFDRAAMIATLERSLTHNFWSTTPARLRTRGWMKQWLKDSDFMSLKRMLMLMTSFPSYVAGRNLILTPSNTNRFYGHTCSNNMEIACDLESYQEFASRLDNILISMEFSSFEEY